MSHVGRVIRHWRAVRRITQEQLAHEAGVSTKQISFIETGRAQPSAEVLEYLLTALRVPDRDKAAALSQAGVTAGFSIPYLGQDEMDSVVESFTPYPTLILDDHWNVHSVNLIALTLLKKLEVLHHVGDGFDATIHVMATTLRGKIRNWDDLWPIMVARARRQKALHPDSSLLGTLEKALSAVGVKRPKAAAADESDRLRIPCEIVVDDEQRNFAMLIFALRSTLDVEVPGLRLQVFVPQDHKTRRWLFSVHTASLPAE